MSALAVIQVVLALLGGVAAAAKQKGLTNIVVAAQGAINELNKVHGTDVTKAQLDSLRVTPSW